MGTRSLTFVYDGGKNSEPILNMYRQFDGYISGHGTELAELLISGEMVNGIPIGEDQLFFNGMGDLAAQIVANFKKGSGGIYIYPISSTDCGQEYEYHVYEDFIVVKNPNEVIFEGSWDEFHSFCYDEVTE